MPELPTGTVTFLFTDLESSTRVWEERREAMAAAVERHDELLEDAIAAHGGVVFSYGGDVTGRFRRLPPRTRRRTLATPS
jgi:class 3 adenylate cyclase